MTPKHKADLIFNDPQAAYYRLIDHRDKEDKYKKLERLKKAAFDTTSERGRECLRKTVLYDLLITEKI